jgi:hypothetical protein
LISASNLNLTDDKTDVIKIRSDNPLTITTHVADNAETQFILGYRPTTSDVAQASNAFSKDGVDFTPTSVSTTTGAVVIPSATAAEIYIALYETAFQAI